MNAASDHGQAGLATDVDGAAPIDRRTERSLLAGLTVALALALVILVLLALRCMEAGVLL